MSQGINVSSETDGRFDLPRRALFRAAPGAIAVALSIMLGCWILFRHSPEVPKVSELAGAPGQTARLFGGLAAPVPHLPPTPLSDPRPYGELVIGGFAPESKFAVLEGDSDPEIPLPPPRPQLQSDEVAPLPPQRPSTFFAAPRPREIDAAPTTGVARLDAKPAAPDERNVIERLFGLQHLSSREPSALSPTLAYASARNSAVHNTTLLGNNFVDVLRGGGLKSSRLGGRYGNGAAVYDISAHIVYMPDGTQLEAHSGLGARLDDPRSVSERMRGATPPATYELTPREALFHGVQALRMTPVEGNVFGRVGLLAHTYMLGPNGDSNGCLSFRDYDAFLRAYQNGQIKKLVVVTSL